MMNLLTLNVIGITKLVIISYFEQCFAVDCSFSKYIRCRKSDRLFSYTFVGEPLNV